MSKPTRRRQRPGFQPSTSRPTGAPPPIVSGTTGEPGTTPDTVQLPATPSPAAARTPGTPAPSSRPRPGGSGTDTGVRPGASTRARAGRRERQRMVYQPTFFERNRTLIVVAGAVVGVAVLAFFVFFQALQPAFACSTVWSPAPTAAPAPGATAALGYVQNDMGHSHVNVGDKVTYTYCPPASGNHINLPGVAGPIPARVYGPNDTALPEGWIHNLEHGALVILYQGASPGATADGQTQLKAFYDSFPNSPQCGLAKGLVGPVIARFDQMATPFAAMVWGRVLPLQTFDQAQIMAFWNEWGEKTNPEPQCAVTTPVPSVAPAASGSAAPSPS